MDSINNNVNDEVNKNVSRDTSTVKCHILENRNNDNNTIAMIAHEVGGLHLNDPTYNSEALERSRKPKRASNNSNHSSTVNETETQGDHLNRIKAQRRNARSATTVTTPISITVEEQRSHRRSASQSKEHEYLSPLKSLKPQFKSTTVSVYNTRSAIRKIQTVNVKDEPVNDMSVSNSKVIRKSNRNSPNIRT